MNPLKTKAVISQSDEILQRLTLLHPKVIDLSLGRVLCLLEELENPQDKTPSIIHIAGTNGKGSTLSFIRAGLEANNKIVHAYISPHLRTFNERITLRGKIIKDTALSDYLERCEKYNSQNNITFFEITTCAAFLAFSEHQADYTLLEVGLGGRLDATNVIKNPIMSIITPISMDHEQFLGDSIIKIAAEKAGILKPNIPAIIGKQSAEVLDRICSIAKDLETPLSIYGRDWISKNFKNKLIYEDSDGVVELPVPKLLGPHQFENAGIAISALKKLKNNAEIYKKAMINVSWPARLQKLTFGPMVSQVKTLPYSVTIWIDGGHNEAAGKAIAAFLKTTSNGNSHLICGMINSKDVKSFILSMNPLLKSINCISIPNENSSLSKEAIYREAIKINPKSFLAESLMQAVDNIIINNKSKKNLHILISGSLYLAGHVLKDHS
jgi:dihydrofolate synthase/folylpolyglutamate synthase